MKISILCIGTRGDVQPNLALAKVLTNRGHDVVFGAPDNFKDWVERHGVRFYPMGVDMQQLIQSPDVRRLLAGNWLSYPKIWKKHIIPMLENSLEAIWEVSRDADVVVYHPKAGAALDVAEVTGVRTLLATPVPIFTTGAFPIMNMVWNLGPWFNKQTYKLMTLGRLIFRSSYNRWRKETLGLGKGRMFAPIEGDGEVLCAVSPSVIQLAPEDYKWVHLTGYWFLDEQPDWQPDQALKAFLDEGEPPVYIGFGSMTSLDPEEVTRNVLEGVELAGVRAILATGWGGLESQDVPGNVHIIDSAPHEVLFKYVKAVVHHGGAGSTAAGLRAGKPTLICPLAVDQPFWGRRIYELGCGPKPLHQKKLRGEIFGARLKELVGTESYSVRAQQIAEEISRENGVQYAVEVIEGGSAL